MIGAFGSWVRRRRPRLQVLALALVTLAALAWRVERALHVPPFFDEGTSIRIAEQVFDPSAPWPRHGGDHPALGIYLLSLSAWLFGRDDLGYRLLNVIAGTMTVPLLAWAVSRLAPRGEALVAALLLAVNPFHVGLSALAIEIPFQILFVIVALIFASGLPEGGRGALYGCAAALGLSFMCNESSVLILIGWMIAVALRPERIAGLRWRDFAIAAGIGLAVVAQDLRYNLTASEPDFYYVNYLDHLARIGRPSFSLHGIAFFLRDLFATLSQRLPEALWVDHRGEYVGPGIFLGVFLLLGWINSLRSAGDPSRGLWSWPITVFVLVTTFSAEVVPSAMLDSATWTWPAPIVGLAAAVAARFSFQLRAPAWLIIGIVLALLALIDRPAGLPWA